MRLLLVLLLLVGPRVLATPADPFDRLAALPADEANDVVWLARCLLSESNRADEQRLVAWVVRNRVETQYRGSGYRGVILEPRQFSAFNEPTPRRAYLLDLDAETRGNAAWDAALGIALDVYAAPASERPFDIETRHFYSPVSMPGGAAPLWALGQTPVALAQDIDPYRFRFYADVDETALRPSSLSGRAAGGTTASSAPPQTRVGARLDAVKSRIRSRVKRPTRR